MTKQSSLFPDNVDKGANFSNCGKYRYSLWRIWDKSKPLVMFIGLNPSTANADTDDATIKSVTRISKHNGYGGFYMMNCFPFISTDPSKLIATSKEHLYLNDEWLVKVWIKSDVAVFAWGNFKIVKESGREERLSKMFPNAKALFVNKNGSPKHPLYCKSDTVLVPYAK